MFLSAIIEAGASRLSRFTMPGSSRAMSSVHLSNLGPAKGSTKDNVRRGRGQGSTKGGTAGRGHKGQLARSGNGKPHPGFEGGQSPLTRRFPKRGFYNYTRRDYAPLSIATLQRWIASGRIDPAEPITIGTVVHSNAVHGLSHQAGIKLLGTPIPDLPFPPLNLQLSRYSKSSAAAVIEAGGEVTAVYHNALALRQELFPHKFPSPVKMADPIRRTDIEFYSNPENHGYLAKRAAAEAAEAKVNPKPAAKTKAKKGGIEAPKEEQAEAGAAQ